MPQAPAARPGRAVFHSAAAAPAGASAGSGARPPLDSPALSAWLRLVLTPGVGPVAARALLGHLGLPEDVFAAGREAVARVVGPALANALLNPDADRDRAVDHALHWASLPDNLLLPLDDPRYPKRLLETTDPPALLYVRGAADRLDTASLAVVGSRSPTATGVENAQAFARALSDAGLVIVSGLARGIDAAAHRGALRGSSGTIGVLGTGVDIVYPREHEGLVAAIVERGGAVVSEMPLATGPRRAGFPRRNRLIAGMSTGVLVVEAALHSGSLITARLAAESGREVFAIPGSIHSPLAKGCHLLIKQGAKLVESAHDVLAELPAARTLLPAGATTPSADTPAAGDRSGTRAAADPLLEALGWDPASVDTLVARGAGSSATLTARLLELELAGTVIRLADGRYQRRP